MRYGADDDRPWNLRFAALWFAGVAVVALVGTYAMAPVPWGYQAAQAKDMVRAELLDADSAKFTAMRQSRDALGKAAWCGFVNAKNRLGGYAGRTWFVVYPDLHRVQFFNDVAEPETAPCNVLEALEHSTRALRQ